jgi:hypothetical protein
MDSEKIGINLFYILGNRRYGFHNDVSITQTIQA